jgi:superfamily II RNA helicase
MNLQKEFTYDGFQQESADHIDNGFGVFVCAPTGSGKTLIAEHGMDYSKKKYPDCVIVYTCPIKSLCNEKYYDMSIKYQKINPDIRVGLMTGDFIINRDADILIMTTEILCNMLVNKNKNDIKNDAKNDLQEESKEDSKEKTPKINDVVNKIKCVIFDEAHYLNDSSRGHVWEKSIILSLLIEDCLLILLSATIGNIDMVMDWLNNINEKRQFKKVVKLDRPVPLREYFIDNTKCKNFKKKDKKSIEDIKEQKKLNAEKGEFNSKISNATNDPSPEEYEILSITDLNYNKIKKYWDKLNDSEYSTKFELQTICNQVASNEGLGIPAIIFVFSKAKCIEYGEMIECVYTTHEERSEILKFYDTNLKEYVSNTQYINLRKIIGSGVGYHHSGLIPKIREVVEFLIKRKLIKFVFATETFALGLNFPVKTVVLLAMNKPTEDGFRNLSVSEYKQMAGRAGRRFIDKYGNVIIWLLGHKNKKFLSWGELNNIVNGPIDRITSKYVIEPIFILKNINDEIHKQISLKSFSYYKSKRNEITTIIIPEKLKKIYNTKIQIEEIEQSGMRCNMKQFDKQYKALSPDNKKEYEDILEQRKNNKKKTDLDYYDDFENDIYNFLEKLDFIKKEENSYELTIKGEMAQLFYEINPIIFINDVDFILKDDVLETLSMFIDDGLKETEEGAAIFNDESIIYFENRTEQVYSQFIKKYPKWNFYPMNYAFLKYWLSDETITLDQASSKFGYDQGVIIKVLVKMYQISDELISNLTKINRTDMIEHVNVKRQLLIRLPLRLESLYVNY